MPAGPWARLSWLCWLGDPGAGMNHAFPCLLAIVAAIAGCDHDATPAGAGRNDAARMGAPRASSAPTASRAIEDAGAGRQIAMQGAPGAPACASCHGVDGEGNAQAGLPRLAGLGRAYIEHQLNSYADGTRANPVMTPIAGALSAQQRAAVASHFARLGAPAPSSSVNASHDPPPLAVLGDGTRGIPACVNCHGAQGNGDTGANPYLAGQNEQYLAAALAAWKDGSRHNDPSGQMPAIAKALGEADSQMLVSYFASLPPPGPRGAASGNR
jgi:cytochrome c553